MKSINSLTAISGGDNSSFQSKKITVSQPGTVLGLPFPVEYLGKTFLGDDSLKISDMNLQIASQDRSFGTCALMAGSAAAIATGMTCIGLAAIHLITRNSNPE